MGFFISIHGTVCKEGSAVPPYPLEEYGIQNWFVNRISAYSLRDSLEEWEPMIFHGEG